MSSKTHKRTDLSLAQRVEIVQLINENKFSQVDLGKRFDCSQSTISKIAKKHKDAILQDTEENRVASRKRKRSAKDDEVETALFTSLVDARARDAAITSTVLHTIHNSLEKLGAHLSQFTCWKVRFWVL